MPSGPIETAYAALAARLQTYCASKLAVAVSRQLKTYDDIRADMQPYMMCVAESMVQDNVDPVGSAWTLRSGIVIYVRADSDPYASAETAMNDIVDAVLASLKVQSGEVMMMPGQRQAWTTLGGVVMWARPDNEIRYCIGEAGQHQGIVTMGVEMCLYPT
jgi:hypothetical protein